MNSTWVLLAHRGGARLYEQERPGSELRLLQDIAHPEGRLKNREISSDKSGRLFDSFHTRHTVSNASEPKVQVAEDFARHIADLLRHGRSANGYRQLVLVAEPQFLGELRAALDPHTAGLVTGSLDKNLLEVPERELQSHLGDLLKR